MLQKLGDGRFIINEQVRRLVLLIGMVGHGGVPHRPHAHVRLIAPQIGQEQQPEPIGLPTLRNELIELARQNLDLLGGSEQALPLLLGIRIQTRAKMIDGRNHAPIKVGFRNKPGDFKPGLSDVGRNVSLPGFQIGGEMFWQRPYHPILYLRKQGIDLGHRLARQTVLCQNASGVFRQPFCNGLTGKLRIFAPQRWRASMFWFFHYSQLARLVSCRKR